MRAFRIVLAIVLVAAATGCGDGPEKTQTPPTAANSAVLCPKNAGADKSFDAQTLVGKLLVKARLEAAKYRCEVRPVSVDGRQLANVQDVRDDRVNVALEKGRISRVLGVY